MTRYARVYEGAVVEVIVTSEGQNIANLYHPDFVATLHEVAGEVEVGWLFDDETFSAPPPVEIPPPPPVSIPVDVFFERTTEDEAEQIETAMMAKSVKIRRAYGAAASFKEGTDVWAELKSELEALFGEPRSAELLSPVSSHELALS